MPVLTSEKFEPELLELESQLSRYLESKPAWKYKSRTQWLDAWLKRNRSWLQTSSLGRGVSIQDTAPMTLIERQGYHKNVIRSLLSNYTQAPWYKRFGWWFSFPVTKLTVLDAAYQVLDLLPRASGDIKNVEPIRKMLQIQSERINGHSRLNTYFYSASNKITFRTNYAFSTMLRASLNRYTEKLARYGRKYKSLFSYQTHAALAYEKKFDRPLYRTSRWNELSANPKKTKEQQKDQEVLYSVWLREELNSCMALLRHPLADVEQQERQWGDKLKSLVVTLKQGVKHLPAKTEMGKLSRSLLNDLERLDRRAFDEVQQADYKKYLMSSLKTDPTESIALRPNPLEPLRSTAGDNQSEDEQIKRLPLTDDVREICIRLRVEGVDSASSWVSWEAIRKRYKVLCLELHPDRQQDETLKQEATRQFQNLQEEYKLLLTKLEGNGPETDISEEIKEELQRANRVYQEMQEEIEKYRADLRKMDEQFKEDSKELRRGFDTIREAKNEIQQDLAKLDEQIDENARRLKEMNTLSDANHRRLKEVAAASDASGLRLKEVAAASDASALRLKEVAAASDANHRRLKEVAAASDASALRLKEVAAASDANHRRLKEVAAASDASGLRLKEVAAASDASGLRLKEVAAETAATANLVGEFKREVAKFKEDVDTLLRQQENERSPDSKPQGSSTLDENQNQDIELEGGRPSVLGI